MAKRVTGADLIGHLAYHQTLLADTRRNRAFHRALVACVRPGQTVLDIGSGSGIWAVVAAGLGARRVVAVERERALKPVIEALARENGVGDRVEVVCADARRVDLPRVFDVVVSETVGIEGFDEGILTLFERARERFLRKGGVLVPRSLALRAAPAAARDGGRLSPPLVSSESFRELARHVPRGLAAEQLKTFPPSRELLRIDLRTARASEGLPVVRARFRVKSGRAVQGIAVWVDMELTPGVSLQTRSHTTWIPMFLPVDPLPPGPGRLDLELDWNASRRRWRVAFEGDRGAVQVSDHSPLFAWGVVRPALGTPASRRGRRR